jgi:ankyrin repeat protein
MRWSAAGARWTGTNALLRQLDHDDLGNLRQALDLGADPNERGPGGRPALHHALLRGRSADFVQLLLDRGADPTCATTTATAPPGTRPARGDRASLALLEARGAGLGASAAEAFIAACAAADEAAAHAPTSRRIPRPWPGSTPTACACCPTRRSAAMPSRCG